MSSSIQVELTSEIRLRMVTMVSTMDITSTGVNSRFIFTPNSGTLKTSSGMARRIIWMPEPIDAAMARSILLLRAKRVAQTSRTH